MQKNETKWDGKEKDREKNKWKGCKETKEGSAKEKEKKLSPEHLPACWGTTIVSFRPLNVIFLEATGLGGTG